MSPEQLVDFTNCFSKFEHSTRWPLATQANYQHMFACKRKMPRNYSVECFTTVHSDVFDTEGIKTLAPLFLVPLAAHGERLGALRLVDSEEARGLWKC